MSSITSTPNSGLSSASKKLDSGHMYQRFIDGLFSDITVKAFEHEWMLHKMALSGSPYFMSLFTKGWKESTNQVLELQIPDQKVTAQGLNACFRSLYTDEIELNGSNVIQILAAASFLQMDKLIQKCVKFMAESMDVHNSRNFYNASIVYGGGETVENACLTILQNWILVQTFLSLLLNQIPKIDTNLMAKVIGSSKTFCFEESNLYSTLTKWLYMKVTGSNFENADYKDQTTQAINYFRQLEGSIPFLSAKEGEPYVEAFRQIRIKDLFTSEGFSVSELREHKIIPHEWIRDAAAENWELTENGIGFKTLSDLNVEIFDKVCTRQGHIFAKEVIAEGFELKGNSLTGIQLNWLKSGNNRFVQITRIAGKLDAKPNEARDYIVRTSLEVTDYVGRIKFSKLSAIRKISLKMDESVKLLELGNEFDNDITFIKINYCLL